MVQTDKQPIVFAFYSGKNLLGYRLDTFGSLGMKNPKIYHYSKEQIQTVIKNVEANFKSGKSPLADAGAFIEPNILNQIIKMSEEVHEKLTESPIVEMRVLKSPGYTWDFNEHGELYCLFDYPHEEIGMWLQTPEEHEIIERHYFNQHGLVNLN